MKTSLVLPHQPRTDPEPENTPEYPEVKAGGDEDFLPWRDNQTEEDMLAAPTPKAELNAEPVGSTPPSPTNLGSTTPKGEEAKRAARMTAAEKSSPHACSMHMVRVGLNRAHSSIQTPIDMRDPLLGHVVRVANPLPTLVLV